MDFTVGTPDNINELVKQANNKNSWRERLDAVNKLSKWKCQQSIDVVTRLAIHDLVFKVKERAFRVAQAFDVKKSGKPVFLGRKPKGHLIKDINKKVYKVAGHLKIDPFDFDIAVFKESFKSLYPEAYDVYEYERDKKFDAWIINIVKGMPKDKRKD